MNTETIQLDLSSKIVSAFPRGKVFFVEDVERETGYAPEILRVILSRMVDEGTVVVRVCRGAFCRPGADPSSGRMILPSPEEIARALAARWRVRIAPSGAHAAFLAGFTGLDVNSLVFVSDGSEQKFHLAGGRTIRFTRRPSVKVFSFSSVLMRNLVEGLRFIGRDGVGDYELVVIRDNMAGVGEEDFLHDVMLSPGWVRKLLLEVRNS